MSVTTDISIKALDMFEIIGKSFLILKQKWVSFVIPFLILAFASEYIDYILSKLSWLNLNTTNIVTLFFSVIILLLLTATLVNITNSTVIQMVADIYLGRETSLQKSLKSAQKMFTSIISAAFIVPLIIVAGFFLLIIPGIIFLIMFSVTMEVVVLERKDVFSALRRSKELASKNWGHIFGVLFMIAILTAIGMEGRNILNMLFIPILGEFMGTIPGIAIYAITILPLYPIIFTVLYFDLLARKSKKTH